MYFKIIDIFIKVLLMALLAFLSSCSRKEAPTRRLPQDNTNNFDYNFAESENDQKVKRADEYYDTYQRYQSNEAPVSLQDLKKARRRPVLNIQELNDIMDNSYSKTHQTKPHKAFEEDYLHDSQAPCTESDCDIEKTIKYNKRKAKKHKFKAKKQNHQSSQKAESTKPQASTNNATLAPIAPAAVTAPQKATTQETPAAIKTPSKISNPAKAEKTIDNTATSVQATPVLPPISLPEATVAKPVVTNSIKQTETAIKPTSAPAIIAPTATSVTPAIPTTTAIAKPIIISPSSVKNETKAITVNSSDIIPPPSTNAPVAVAKLNKYTKETKLDTFNNLLVKYIFTIKSKIASIFSSEE